MQGVKATLHSLSGADFLTKIFLSAVIVLTVSSLGFAAATQLGAGWSGNFQAGAVGVSTTCQPASQPLAVTMGEPDFVGTGDVPWRLSEVSFSQISPACIGLKYEVTYRVGQVWQALPSPSESVIDSSQLSVDLSGADISRADEFSLTFFN